MKRRGRPRRISDDQGRKANFHCSWESTLISGLREVCGQIEPFNTWLRNGPVGLLLKEAEKEDFGGFRIRPLPRKAPKTPLYYECSLEERDQLRKLAKQYSIRAGKQMRISTLLRHAAIMYLEAQRAKLVVDDSQPPVKRRRRAS
jgi:hypothetical protein